MKVYTAISDDNTRMAKVYDSDDWGESIVQFYLDGIHQTQANYHTDDRADAISTADWFVAQVLA